MTPEESFAAVDKLVELLKEARVPGKTLCRLFGITRQAWWFWRKRTWAPSPRNAELIASVSRGLASALAHGDLPTDAELQRRKANSFKWELYVKRTIVKHMNK